MSDAPRGPVIASSPATPAPPHEPPTAPPPPNLIDRTFLTGVAGVTELLLVRHGQQDRGAGAFIGGPQPDPPLSATGREQARLVGEGLAAAPIDAVYCSTLRRAADTAAAIAGHHGVEPVVHEELREVEVYRDVPEGSTISDVVSRTLLRGVQRRFAAERRWDVFPYSETSEELRHRVVAVVEGILATHDGGRVVVACHGGVVNAYLAHVLRLEEDMFFNAAHASVSRVLVHQQRRVVHTVNETHHLTSDAAALVTY